MADPPNSDRVHRGDAKLVAMETLRCPHSNHIVFFWTTVRSNLVTLLHLKTGSDIVIDR